jgi:serine/threonine protein kinase
MPDEAMDFIAGTLAYTPSRRLKPLKGYAHSFFDELRDESTELLNNGGPLPPVFDFTEQELKSSQDLLEKVSPTVPTAVSTSFLLSVSSANTTPHQITKLGDNDKKDYMGVR